LQALRRRLRAPVEIPLQTATRRTEARSEFGADAFQAAVARSREYIAAGDIMQVVLSQRMAMPFAASPLSLYRALRSINPSPYMFYYDLGDFHVVGARGDGARRVEGAHAGDHRRAGASSPRHRRRRGRLRLVRG